MNKVWVIVFVGALLILTLALDRFISQKNADKRSSEDSPEENDDPSDAENDGKTRL